MQLIQIIWKPSWRNGRRAWFRSKFFHRSGGSTPPDGTKIFCKKLRVWHNGCAPAFQAGYRGSTPLTRSIKILVGFPSGQRGQTVNLLAQLSMVRIHLPPPFTYSTVCKDGFFVLKLPDLRRFLHLAANWWWDRVFPTFFPQNSHNVENFPPPFKLSDRGVS